MVARTLILFTITALILAGFVWLAPLDVVLKAHGYSPAQIEAMKRAAEPQPGAATEVDPNAAATGAQKPPTTQTGGADAQPQQDTPEQEKGKPEQTSEPTEQPAAKTEPPPARKFVATDTVNVRAGQGTDTAVVGQLKPDAVVSVIEDPSGDWMKIESGTVTGWVYRPLFERQSR